MILSIKLDVAGSPDPALEPYRLFRDQILPVLVEKRGPLDAMYDPEIGRPEADPVLLLGMSLLQYMNRLPDRQSIAQCRFDARWRMALELAPEVEPPNASTLCRFRARMAEHAQARLVMDAGLEAMRRAGYLGQRRAVRIDSTHVLGQLAMMSRLACVRETIRLALDFLANWGGHDAWEPWLTRYAERDPKELRQISKDHFRATMAQTGGDLRDMLDRTLALGETVPASTHSKGEPTDAVITAMVVQSAITGDQGSLSTVLQAHTERIGEAPQTVFADAGYIHAPALEQAQASGYELCGPVAAPPHSGKRFGSDSFAVDIPNRTATCPNGKSSCECVRGYGGRRCRYRGQARATLQMQFIGAACNLRRWANRRCWLARKATQRP